MSTNESGLHSSALSCFWITSKSRRVDRIIFRGAPVAHVSMTSKLRIRLEPMRSIDRETCLQQATGANQTTTPLLLEFVRETIWLVVSMVNNGD